MSLFSVLGLQLADRDLLLPLHLEAQACDLGRESARVIVVGTICGALRDFLLERDQGSLVLIISRSLHSLVGLNHIFNLLLVLQGEFFRDLLT